MRTAIVLFTRDLRVHDQPALAAAVETAEQVVPLFVFDPGVLERFGAPNRVAFLLDSLRDLARSLRERGGGLAVRQGHVVAETMRVAIETGAARSASATTSARTPRRASRGSSASATSSGSSCASCPG
ncbi:MAG: deoxyribodipyrimidine photo-lyase [Gaiellaceae bacterium MAG52_C11]|nr:deoxyribodipyrimidine photo-lyase [Candidatus Gaiellasilicea maunaloa]